MDWSRGLDVPPDQLPWSFDSPQQQQNRYRDKGFELVVLENRPPMGTIKLGIPGKDDEIKQVVELVRNMDRLEIPVWYYEWMPVFDWIRTSTKLTSRGGALVTGFRLEDITDHYENEHQLNEKNFGTISVTFWMQSYPRLKTPG